ncbi:MAG TPA: CARDB domain-containing protein [Solirubrobacteraceae bacterium]
MRRVLAASVALALAGTGAATTVSAAAPPTLRVSLAGFVCQTALDPPTRGIAVKAVMRPVPSTVAMQIKFDLLRAKRRGGQFRLVKARRVNLGRWISPLSPTLGQLPGDVWNSIGEVANLPAPALYRLRVTFRWLGTGSVRLAQTVRSSSVCFQPELRPDLVMRSLAIAPLASKNGVDTYDAVVANRGATAAGSFDVSLAVAQTVVDTISIPQLGPHRSRQAHLSGPACTTGEVITITADPAHRVDVYDRSRGALAVVCP